MGSLFREPCGYDCLPYLLWVMKSPLPIADSFLDFRNRLKDIHIFYGAEDWMDFEITEKFFETNNLDMKIQYIKEGEHQLLYATAEQLA
jgi:hypothetical protein